MNYSTAQNQTANEVLGPDTLIVDVRSPEEYNAAHVDGAVNWPLDRLANILAEKGPEQNRDIVLYCASGGRAGVAQTLFQRAGYDRVKNVGGIASLAHLGLC
jgi:phage shock protein E